MDARTNIEKYTHTHTEESFAWMVIHKEQSDIHHIHRDVIYW